MKAIQYTTKDVALMLGITYVALRLRMSRGMITRPVTRKITGHLVWTRRDVKRAMREVSR